MEQNPERDPANQASAPWWSYGAVYIALLCETLFFTEFAEDVADAQTSVHDLLFVPRER
jgi:hypothetical protein